MSSEWRITYRSKPWHTVSVRGLSRLLLGGAGAKVLRQDVPDVVPLARFVTAEGQASEGFGTGRPPLR